MTVLQPPAVLGVLGSGQLGRMFCQSAHRLGYKVHVYSPDANSPTGQIADREWVAPYNDEVALSEFAKSVQVVTFEFENVPSAITNLLGKYVPVRPNGNALFLSQNRLREKGSLAAAGLPVTPFQPVRSEQELIQALARWNHQGVLKTASSGYDGKGQVLIRNREQAHQAWDSLKTDEAILEQFISFECELSVVAARSVNGEIATFGPFRNRHANHILDVSTSPTGLPDATVQRAIDIAKAIAVQWDIVGLICVELFLTTEGTLLINETAPRPHNSGHLTMDAHLTSQFEQHVRAICGLPLGSTVQTRPAAMVNLLGDLWAGGEPHWDRLDQFPGATLHLYGKTEARNGRKMGHLTVLADDVATAESIALQARARLVE